MSTEAARLAKVIENAKARGRLIRRVQTAGQREAAKDETDST